MELGKGVLTNGTIHRIQHSTVSALSLDGNAVGKAALGELCIGKTIPTSSSLFLASALLFQKESTNTNIARVLKRFIGELARF